MQYQLRWLPNALTISRMVFAVAMFAAALRSAWMLAFVLFLAALATDFLDGLAAKKLNAKTRLGGELDPYADSAVAVAGLLSLSFTGRLSWWLALAALAVGAAISSDRVIPGQKAGPLRVVSAVSCLFIMWVGIGWAYASQAFGWRWWYALVTLAVLVCCGVLKRHRVRAWLAGRG